MKNERERKKEKRRKPPGEQGTAISSGRRKTACRHFGRIPRITSTDKPVPKEFLKHAKTCKRCRLWLSYLLAVNKAFLSTITRFYNNGCPPKSIFKLMLIIAVRDPGISKERIFAAIKNSGEETAFSEQTRKHLENCGLCEAYSAELYEEVERWQKKYDEAISKEQEIRPVIEDAGREIKFSKIVKAEYLKAIEAMMNGKLPELSLMIRRFSRDKQRPN